MAQESNFTEAEKESIEIEHFIFHLIKKDDIKPEYLDEVKLSASQINFFKQRFQDASSGVQYEFTEKDDSDVYNHCKNIIDNPEENFYSLSRRLTSNFRGVFKGSSSDGVFVISMVSISGNKYIFLLKMDHRKVYSYKVEDKRALIEEIKNNLVEDKQAIQKNAIISISKSKPWDALVLDRSRPGGITDYFKEFLKVIERDTDSVLTKKVYSVVTKWAFNCKGKTTKDPSYYKSRTYDYLKSKSDDVYSSKDMINFILLNEDDSTQELRTELQSALNEKDLSDREFVPKPNSLSPKNRKNVRKSSEGVTVEWEGNAQTVGIEFEENHNKSSYKMIISSNSPFTDLDND